MQEANQSIALIAPLTKGYLRGLFLIGMRINRLQKSRIALNFTRDTGIFEDKLSGSFIYLEFDDSEQVSKIHFSLQGEDGIVHRWVRMFQHDFGATI